MRQKQHGFSVLHLLLVLVILGLVGLIGYRVYSTSTKKEASITTDTSTAQLTAYTIQGEATNGSPEFTVNFYKNADVEHKSGLIYLISKAPDGVQSSVWVYKLKNENPVCDSGGTPFTVVVMNQTVPACYRNDRIIYTADITHNGIRYQANLVSQKPIEVSEAKPILSSIVLK